MKPLLIENCSPRNPLFSYGAKTTSVGKQMTIIFCYNILVYFSGPDKESSNIDSVLKLSLNLSLYVSFLGTLLKFGLAASPSKITAAKLLLLDESLFKEL
jgi:hypothetical protein